VVVQIVQEHKKFKNNSIIAGHPDSDYVFFGDFAHWEGIRFETRMLFNAIQGIRKKAPPISRDGYYSNNEFLRTCTAYYFTIFTYITFKVRSLQIE